MSQDLAKILLNAALTPRVIGYLGNLSMASFLVVPVLRRATLRSWRKRQENRVVSLATPPALLVECNLFDYLVGASEHRWRNCEAKCLGRFEVYHKLVLGRRLNRHVGRLLALEDAIDVVGSMSKLVDIFGTV